MAGFFNDLVQCDLFFLWNKIWALLTDEATRFKIAGLLASLKLPPNPSHQPQLWIQTASPTLLRGMSRTALNYREVLYELLQSERSYVRHMAIFDSIFSARLSLRASTSRCFSEVT